MRRVFFWASVALLLFVGLSGLQGSIADWSLASDSGQRLSAVGQLIFGVSGLAAGLGGILGKPWTAPAALVFAVSAGATAGLATVVWGGGGVGEGIGSGGLGLFLGMLLYLGVTSPPGEGGEGRTGPSNRAGV